MDQILRIALFSAIFSCININRIEAAESKNRLRIPLAATQISFDPSGVQDQSSLWVSRQINCQLFRMSSGNVIPEAAKSVQFKNPTLISVTLRDDFSFADGSTITSDDVIASFENIKQSRSVLRNVFPWIKKIEKISNSEIAFHLSLPQPQLLKAFSAPNFAIFKASFIAEAHKNPILWQQPNGCGKYKISGGDSPQVIKLAPRGKGPQLEFLLSQKLSASGDTISSFDVIGVPIEGDTSNLSLFRQQLIFDPYQIFVALNAGKKPWSEKSNRCAIYDSIDAAPLLQAYGSAAEPPQDIFPRGVLGFSNSPGSRSPVNASTTVTKLQKAVSKGCISILGVSIPSQHREILKQTIVKALGTSDSKIIEDPRRFGRTFVDSGCEAIVFGLKSNYLDGYEYLAVLAEEDANVVNLKDGGALSRRIKDTQSIADSHQRSLVYQELSTLIQKECLLRPLISIPRKTILIRRTLKTPGIGEVSLNDYDLSQVEL